MTHRDLIEFQCFIFEAALNHFDRCSLSLFWSYVVQLEIFATKTMIMERTVGNLLLSSMNFQILYDRKQAEKQQSSINHFIGFYWHFVPIYESRKGKVSNSSTLTRLELSEEQSIKSKFLRHSKCFLIFNFLLSIWLFASPSSRWCNWGAST